MPWQTSVFHTHNRDGGAAGTPAVAPPRPGLAGGQCPWVSQEEGDVGERGVRRSPFCLQTVSCCTPGDQFEFEIFARTVFESGPGDQAGVKEEACFQLSGTQNGGPTTYRGQHKATSVAHTVCGPGEHLEQTERQEKDNFAALEKG